MMEVVTLNSIQNIVGLNLIVVNHKGCPNCNAANRSIVGNGDCESKWINPEEWCPASEYDVGNGMCFQEY